MFFLPFPGFPKLPAIYDVTIQNEIIASVIAEKIDNLPYMRITYTQVNV